MVGAIIWAIAMIVAIGYDNGKIATKEITNDFLSIVGTIFVLIFFPAIVFGQRFFSLIKKRYTANNRKIIKKVIAITFLICIFVGYNYAINIYTEWGNSNLLISTVAFITTGIIVFIYMLLGMPFVAMWLTHWENDYILIKFISKVAIALHILLIFPLVWLTE